MFKFLSDIEEIQEDVKGLRAWLMEMDKGYKSIDECLQSTMKLAHLHTEAIKNFDEHMPYISVITKDIADLKNDIDGIRRCHTQLRTEIDALKTVKKGSSNGNLSRSTDSAEQVQAPPLSDSSTGCDREQGV